MPMHRISNLTGIVSLTVIVFGLIFFSVWASGGTFGQRCAAAYPGNPAEQEWCIDRVANGGFVYPKPDAR